MLLSYSTSYMVNSFNLLYVHLVFYLIAFTVYLFFFFFFFQAEDGIRDLTVTGVQTCALPISDALSTLFFFVIVVSLFPLSIGPDTQLLRSIASGLVWVAALLASMLSLGRDRKSVV